MAGKSLQDLGLKAESVGGAGFDELPEQQGSYLPPPQPGSYRFQLPASLTNIWDTREFDGKTRLVALFDADNPLTIVQSPGNQRNLEPFRTQITNNERNRARKGQPEVLVSDMDYLLKALGETKRPATNKAYLEALAKYAGKDFAADVTWSWSCNPKKPKRVPDGEGGSVEAKDEAGQPEMGCGKRYYPREVRKDGQGQYPLSIACECGALLRAFPNLSNFQA